MNSLNLFSYKLPFRQKVVAITEYYLFDVFIIGLIIIGSICQAAYDYSNLENELNKVLDQIMNAASYIFIMEATMKIIC